MRTYDDIAKMADQDYSIGLSAHYKPLAALINERAYFTMIEVGTAYAGNALHLMRYTNLQRLTCIDPYKFYPAMPGFTCQAEYDTLLSFAYNRLKGTVATIERLTSRQAIEDKVVPISDIIFLDGSHEYEDVKWECENYSKLVNVGGVLSGHDYNIFEGVNKAVDEFAKQTGKEPHFLPGNIWYINY